jgi:acid phosphatase
VLLTLLLLAVATCPAARAVEAVPDFEHVIVIVFENKEKRQVIGSGAAPTFTAMARRYATISRYYAVAHPSLPNYIAMISGSTHGIRRDCTACVVDAPNLADTFEEAGRSWKTYAEGLPRPGFTGAAYRRYVKKHVPFLYFRNIASSPSRRGHVVSLKQLHADLASDALPDFALVVPDLCNSMHDCPIRIGDRWLRAALPPLLRIPNTTVFVTFDEGTRRPDGNHIPAFALGTAVSPGSRFAELTGHYGLLRTIEAAWSLPLLGHSAHSAPITGIWR